MLSPCAVRHRELLIYPDQHFLEVPFIKHQPLFVNSNGCEPESHKKGDDPQFAQSGSVETYQAVLREVKQKFFIFFSLL